MASTLAQRLNNQSITTGPRQPVAGVGFFVGGEAGLVDRRRECGQALARPRGNERKIRMPLDIADDAVDAEHQGCGLVVEFDITAGAGLAAEIESF